MRGIIFVGGFSYSDTLGSANGWYNVIINNENIKKQFDSFYNREDTFSLGVCNGFQLMSKLGWLDVDFELTFNDSNRFESRFVNVKIEKNNNIFLNNLEGLEMGIWIAHGEGKVVTNNIKELNNNSVMRFCDNKYPLNPNGSIDNITGISSNNGRHLGMMPHPERCIMNWQLPYISDNISPEIKKLQYSPWFLMFKNVYEWCL
jgi:phosphoribosylformylglycinamidine synthase